MFIAPMLLESRPEPFSDDGWIFEPKLDGHRVIMSRQSDETRLWTMQGNECTRQFPELHLPPMAGDFVLDGEVCCTDPETEAIDVELVMERFRLKKKNKIDAYSKQQPVNYIVWDILFHKGRDLRQLPLMKRRSILESVLESNPNISIVPHIDGRGEDLWEYVVANRMEGIVGKRKNSKYVSRQSHDWQQIINYQFADVYLAGYRKDGSGWLIHLEENGRLRPSGMLELGVTAEHRETFMSLSRKLQAREGPSFVYLEPKIRARVKYRNRTRGGMLRKPELVQICAE
ncbi:ATP-dependent DNA ligase [Paenibacillus sp. tmac-D7]|nr:ATP-dependent DNA ligase [Paenibacillus sp. tmac-D7]